MQPTPFTKPLTSSLAVGAAENGVGFRRTKERRDPVSGTDTSDGRAQNQDHNVPIYRSKDSGQVGNPVCGIEP
jgi:hypothetical protein